MIINKHANKNHYLRTEDGLWVRNFTKSHTKSIDINRMFSDSDCHLLLSNELTNIKRGAIDIDGEILEHPDVAIVSDGFDFDRKQEALSKLPSNVVIIGVNGALDRWKLVGKNCPQELRRMMSCYVVNNPYSECLRYLPKHHPYYPQCIASIRTNPEFLDGYHGNIALYSPVPSEYYAGPKTDPQYFIDDYRNPICAAIGLAYRFHVRRLMLFCCDDSFADMRPGAISLKNGMWCYPQQRISQRIIDCNLYWLKSTGVQIADCSSGFEYNNAKYISEVGSFFEEEEEIL